MTTHRVALITGDTGNLGGTIAIRPYARRRRVVITHLLSNTRVITWIVEQHAQGRLFQTFTVDVADYDAYQQCASNVPATVDPVDILVNNVGVTRDVTFKRMTLDAWRDVLAADLDPVFNMTKPLYEGMIKHGWGRIINISPVNGSRGAFGQTNYTAAKTGIHEFTKALTLKCAAKGVTVNITSPGYLAMRMTRDIPNGIM